MNRAAVVVVLSLTLAGSSQAMNTGAVRTSVDLTITGWQLTSHASASFECFDICVDGRLLSGRHAINSDTLAVTGSETFSAVPAPWSGTLYPSGASDTCFRATVDASTQYGESQGAGSSQVCSPPTMTSSSSPGGVLSSCGDSCAEPLLIPLATGKYELSGTNDPVSFDINNDGVSDRISWTAPTSDLAFLAIDRNGNGSIDNGGEIFGNATVLKDGSRAPNGFAALADLDGNGDGVIDARDAVWSHLLLWVDRNHDGKSEPSELLPVSASGVTAIETSYHWSGRVDAEGNYYGFESHFHRGEAVQPFYDVFFSWVK